MPKFIVAIQDTPPCLCVADCIDGLSCEVWHELEGIRTPILQLWANTPIEAATRYLNRVPFPKSKLEYMEVNTDVYQVYNLVGGQWQLDETW